MNAFIPTTGLSAVSGRSVLASQNGDATCTLRSWRTARMSVSYPYTGSGYGAAGIPYGGSSTGVGYAATSTSSIVETAASVPIFGTLVNLLVETGLDYELNKGGPFTVFAPTDDAFASLLNPHGFATLGALLRPENRAYLKDVLAYHVVLGDISASSSLMERS